MLYRSTDRLCRCGAAVKNLAHSASFHSLENNAPSNPGIKQLGVADRLGVLSDAEALGLAGYAPASDTLQLAQQARPAMDPLVLDAVANQLSELVQFYRDLPTKTAYESYARAILEPLLAKVGWNTAPNEDPNVTILRSDLLSALCDLDDPSTVARARDLFEVYVHNPEALSGDQRVSVLRIVAAHADPAIWDQ